MLHDECRLDRRFDSRVDAVWYILKDPGPAGQKGRLNATEEIF